MTCTFTNTRQRATLTLQKTWINGAAGDTANLSINGGPPVDRAPPTATSGPDTSPDTATATVLSGSTVTLSRSSAGLGSYDSRSTAAAPRSR